MTKNIKVISIGTDRKIFEEGSAVRQRQVEYGQLFEKLEIIVFSSRSMNYESKIMLSENIYAYPTSSNNRFFALWDAYKLVKGIIHNSDPIIQNMVLSTQDP